MKNFISIILCVSLLCSCSDSGNHLDLALQAPSDITVERLQGDEIILRWTDNSDNEDGFIISQRGINDQEYKDIGQVEANISSFTVKEGVQENQSYYFTVKAFSSEGESRTASILYKMLSSTELPAISLLKTDASSACVSFLYKIENVDINNILEFGLCWSATATPTVDDQVQIGPERAESTDSVLQVIPNVLLEYNRSYEFRAYLTTSQGTFYSGEVTTSLGEELPSIALSWNKLSESSLPDEIELYETTTALNGRNFHAWYAIGDLSTGNIEVRANLPDKAMTVDDQVTSFNGNCYLMVNGGYFYNGKHVGIAVINSVESGSISQVRGSLKTNDDEYHIMYNVTRGVFGVDNSGVPSVYWGGVSTQNTLYYFDAPLPSVKGEAQYSAVSQNMPEECANWNPKYALSAGPVLLKNGKIPFDFTLTSKGADYYLSNYEIIPYDIFGASVSPDRTAVGYRKDGKVVFFVCDGRIANSQGVTLIELAQIMKGLGCIGAINLDGGGSTAMVVGNKHLNDQTTENRPVASSIGFFKVEK